MMLSEFISDHRQEILDLTRQKVLIRMAPRPTESEIEHGVPLFLDQLAEVLKEQSARGSMSDPQLGRAAAGRGGDRLRLGFMVDQLVHDCGDVCQAITELAVDLKTPISTDNFRTLNKCLDYAASDLGVGGSTCPSLGAESDSQDMPDRTLPRSDARHVLTAGRDVTAGILRWYCSLPARPNCGEANASTPAADSGAAHVRFISRPATRRGERN